MASRHIRFVVTTILFFYYNDDTVWAKKLDPGTAGRKTKGTFVTRDTACASKREMKIAIVIPTHNRQEYVKLMADGLRASIGIRRIEIWIFDDASTDYGEDELREWFTYAQKGILNTHILTVKKRVGAHINSRRILEEVLQRTDANVIVHLDSDLILTPTWLMKLKGWMTKSDGIMTMYRSDKIHHGEFDCDKRFCMKSTIGSAGTVWCRKLLETVLSEITEKPTAFDFQFSMFLSEHEFRILVPVQSPAIHYGVFSSRSKRQLTKTTDIGGVNFKWKTLDKNLAKRTKAFLEGASPDTPSTDQTDVKKPKKKLQRLKRPSGF